MIFPSLSMSLLGFAAVASAAPHLHSRYERSVAKRELGPLAERGLGWVSRDTSGLYSRQKGDRGRGNNVNVAADITITELSVDVVDQKKRGDDVVLVQLIQQRLLVIDNSEQFKDNVRRNTFRNKNQNVNTVIILVVEVVDQRNNNNNNGNQNKRYITRQIESNSNKEEKAYVVISESNQFTVGPEDLAGIAGATGVAPAPPAPTGDVQKFATFDPAANASFQGDNSRELLPSGAAPPKWNNAKESVDPAEILLRNPPNDVFVAFENEDYQNQGDAIVVAISL